MVRQLAVARGRFARQVQVREFFEGRLNDVEQHAKRAKISTLELQEHVKGGNIARLAVLTSHIDEILRSIGEAFDSDDN